MGKKISGGPWSPVAPPLTPIDIVCEKDLIKMNNTALNVVSHLREIMPVKRDSHIFHIEIEYPLSFISIQDCVSSIAFSLAKLSKYILGSH